ncbi:MAG: hypothetical protein K0R10_1040 [Alphaproteobacteria bacterium]|jgi:hypothetical protein|nr:hypothetical protein [Alphaproteobacteria bacterium]
MASCSLVKVQVIRGVIGVAALTAAYFASASFAPLSFLLLGIALYAMKGCPVCWIFEMCEAVDKSRKPAAENAAGKTEHPQI